MRPADLRRISQEASALITYPEVKSYLQDHLAPEFQELGMKFAMILVAPRIVEMSSLDERRRVIDTYPDQDGTLIGIRDEVKFGVQRLWGRRPHPTKDIDNGKRRAEVRAEGQRGVPAQRAVEFL